MSVTYKVEVVGTKFLERFTSQEEWANYISRVWSVLGPQGVANVQDEIGQVPWIHPTGNLQRAVSWESSTWSMIIYMDDQVAPYAIYQEVGVREHVMRYLLTASSPIPVPSASGGTAYRWATERWMGVPHPFIDDEGNIRQATGWTHPGYPGKRYFRRGMVRTMEQAAERLKGVVLRMSEEE